MQIEKPTVRYRSEFVESEKNGRLFLSPCQPVRLTAPSSEEALGRYHLYSHVLVNDPTTGYGIFIENMLDAAA